VAWVEEVRGRFRVRYRHNGRILCDSTHDDEQAAEERRLILEASLGRRKRLYEPGPAPQLNDWVPIWWDARRVGEAVLKRDESLLRTHLLPAFGRRRLSAIDVLSVQAFTGDLRQRLAFESVKSIQLLLHKIMRDAVAMHVLPCDPMDGVRLRDEVRVPRPTLDQAQVIAIAERMPTLRLRVMVISAAATGMRFGELAGLAPQAIDLRTSTAQIDPKVGELHEVAGKRWLGPPKPPSGPRPIHLPPYLVEGWAPLVDQRRDGVMFTADHGQWLWRSNFARRIWRPACDGDPARGWQPLCPGLRFHDLRGVHRTWMDEDEISEVVKAKRLGHKLGDIRDHYTTLTHRMVAPLMAALQRRWEQAGATW
jgi:integrase